MPYSAGRDQKQQALGRFSHPDTMARIRGVVDLGAGAGVWRRLARPLPIGQVPWVAIEVYRPYVKRFNLRKVYDHVRVRSLTSLKYAGYAGNVFIFGDVLEHLERADAVRVLRRASSVGTVVVMMPFLPSTSEHQGGIESEQHRYVWRWDEWLDELRALGRRFEIVTLPLGSGRNKGITILWHPDHLDG